MPGHTMYGHLCSVCMVLGWKAGMGNAAEQGWAGRQGAPPPRRRAAAHPAPMLRHSGVPGGAVAGHPMPRHLCSQCMVPWWKAGMSNAAGQGWAGGQGAPSAATAGRRPPGTEAALQC